MTRVARFATIRLFAHIDWTLLASVVAISLLGIATMHSFSTTDAFFERQIIWLSLSVAVFFTTSLSSYHFLRRTPVITALYVGIGTLLALIFLFGAIVKGAQQRFDLGLFFVQPSDPAKLVLIALLAKYFARRHIEIRHIRHILLSGAYALTIFALVFLQPDFGSGIIIFAIWLGMVLVAGISWKHLALFFLVAALLGAGAWQYGLQDYQKDRIFSFLNPLADIQGAGYNAYQSTIAVGSGEVWGKGVGYGTQSKLQFLPEYQTDFIFAAYAEEWGFVGVAILLTLFCIVIFRILMVASHATDNFDTLLAAGVAVYFFAQFIVHVGMNMGLLPITGTTLPFMSYGGSHLLTEYAALGLLMGLRKGASASRRVRSGTEIVGAL